MLCHAMVSEMPDGLSVEPPPPLGKLAAQFRPNRNGPFHLINQPKFPEFWVEWK